MLKPSELENPDALATPEQLRRQLPPLWFAASTAITIIALFTAPLWADSGVLRSLVDFLTLLALAQLWNLLAGYAGLVSIGQQAWIGIGGYALFVVVNDWNQPVPLGLLVGGLLCAVLAVPAAALVFRLRGGYFSVGTWVIAEVFRLLVNTSSDWLRGAYGLTLNLPDLAKSDRELLTYGLATGVTVLIIGLTFWMLRSRVGLALTAIRDSESSAASSGIYTTRTKLLVYVLCAAGTGVVGGVIYLNLIRITPDASFSVQWTAFMIFIVVIGGIGTIEGPIIGAVLFYLIRENLAGYGEWSIIILGLVAVLIMLFAPEGLWGLVKKRFHLEFFPVSRWLKRA